MVQVSPKNSNLLEKKTKVSALASWNLPMVLLLLHIAFSNDHLSLSPTTIGCVYEKLKDITLPCLDCHPISHVTKNMGTSNNSSSVVLVLFTRFCSSGSTIVKNKDSRYCSLGSNHNSTSSAKTTTALGKPPKDPTCNCNNSGSSCHVSPPSKTINAVFNKDIPLCDVSKMVTDRLQDNAMLKVSKDHKDADKVGGMSK